ncbi:MAG: pyruvate kinase [Bacilli bacterium]|nr:pyruvate kinase [Bacilli bacterium]
MKKTKIIATIGPQTKSIESLKELILNGIDVIRLNMSHANYSFCNDVIKKVNELNEELNTSVAILMDTAGPDIRVGRFIGGSAYFKKDDKIRIYMNELIGDNTKFSVSYNIQDEVHLDTIIKIDDGSITLKVISKGDDYILCEVIEGGIISDHKSVNIPGIRLDRSFLTEQDKQDILYASKKNIDYLALSFVSSSDDILSVSDLLIEQNNNHMQIIAKIECQNAIDDIDEIIKISDGIMIARGDLGVELPIEKVPSIQKQITHSCHTLGKLCIVATEMLSSMEEANRPTRAEVNDIASAVMDGVDAVMLSAETASGKHPVEAVQMMKRIIEETEKSTDYYDLLTTSCKKIEQDITGTIAYNVAETAYSLNCKAIITPTISGFTAKRISQYRPKCPIIAVSPEKDTVKSLMLNYGVIPVLIDELKSLDRIIVISIKEAQRLLNLKEQDKIVITGGYPFKDAKHTNFMKIEEL